jgi:uncharacterized protein (DUF2062 family)
MRAVRSYTFTSRLPEVLWCKKGLNNTQKYVFLRELRICFRSEQFPQFVPDIV